MSGQIYALTNKVQNEKRKNYNEFSKPHHKAFSPVKSNICSKVT